MPDRHKDVTKINGFMKMIDDPRLQEQLEALAKEANEVEGGKELSEAA